MKLVPFLLALTLFGAVASSAGAAPRSTATASDLCSIAKGVASSITHSGATVAPTGGTSIASLENTLKATYTHIKSAESLVLAKSPSSLKPHFVKVFAFDNMVYAELSKANWNILAFAKNAKSLESGAAKIKPDLLAIQAYFAKCKK
ncbi:MAG TPA: hypothetical protein VIE38_14915 [Gaiellaceae bacterium]|jgi:hypothetical protein